VRRVFSNISLQQPRGQKHHLTIDITGLHLFSDDHGASLGDSSNDELAFGSVVLVRSSPVPGEKARGLPIVLVKRTEGVGFATGWFVIPRKTSSAPPLSPETVKEEDVTSPGGRMDVGSGVDDVLVSGVSDEETMSELGKASTSGTWSYEREGGGRPRE
jgi:hypothetical protein